MSFHCPDKFRVRRGEWATENGDPFGAFFIPVRLGEPPLKVIATDGREGGADWEHVSVSLPHRCPTWMEMCAVKDAFWDPEDTVMQLHPPRSAYVNNHPFCLHLWRPPAAEPILLPPALLVGLVEQLDEKGR